MVTKSRNQIEFFFCPCIITDGESSNRLLFGFHNNNVFSFGPPIKPPWDIQLCMLGRIEQEFDFYRPWLCSCYFCSATYVTEYVVVMYLLWAYRQQSTSPISSYLGSRSPVGWFRPCLSRQSFILKIMLILQNILSSSILLALVYLFNYEMSLEVIDCVLYVPVRELVTSQLLCFRTQRFQNKTVKKLTVRKL